MQADFRLEMERFLGKRYSNKLLALEVLRGDTLRKSSIEGSRHSTKCPHKVIKNNNDRLR